VPLGRAVIGGLFFATAATLLILPLVFSMVQERAGVNRRRSIRKIPKALSPASRRAIRILCREKLYESNEGCIWPIARQYRCFCISCGSNSGSSPNTAKRKGPRRQLPLWKCKVVSKKLAITVHLPGELQPYEMVAIYPKVTAFVDSISVDRGSVVKAGQLMARLVAPEIAAQACRGAIETPGSGGSTGRSRSQTRLGRKHLRKTKSGFRNSRCCRRK